MTINGIDKVVYGVEDLDTCIRFFEDWGLRRIEGPADGALFETLDGSQVELRPADAADLPPAFEAGSTLRRVVWGLSNGSGLETLRARIGGLDSFEDEKEGPSCTDPVGLRQSFRVSRRRQAAVAGSPSNTVDTPARVDRRGAVYERGQPVWIGHVVLFASNAKSTMEFYQEILGFVLSDYYPDGGYFLRCAPEGGHHDLFILQTPDRKRGLNHVAFTVRDIHEVFGGGLNIARRGWKTQIGPGRHPISSAYFWYVECPAGGLVEYYADEDYCTADWQPQAWERSSANFAEWAVVGGLDPETRRQSEIKK